MSWTPPTIGRSMSPIRNNSMFLRLHKWGPQFGSTSRVHDLGLWVMSTNRVHESGPRFGSTGLVHKFGPQVGSTGRVHKSWQFIFITINWNSNCLGKIYDISRRDTHAHVNLLWVTWLRGRISKNIVFSIKKNCFLFFQFFLPPNLFGNLRVMTNNYILG